MRRLSIIIKLLGVLVALSIIAFFVSAYNNPRGINDLISLGVMAMLLIIRGFVSRAHKKRRKILLRISRVGLMSNQKLQQKFKEAQGLLKEQDIPYEIGEYELEREHGWVIYVDKNDLSKSKILIGDNMKVSN